MSTQPRSLQTASRGRRLVLAALLGLGATGLALLLGEVAMRVIAPQPRLVISPPGFYVADPPGRYRLTSGYRGTISNRSEFAISVRINEHGLRGGSLPPSEPGARRLLAIGDSFAFGVGVEETETFVARLAAELGRPGRPVVPLNGGVPAFGVPDAVGWYERHGRLLAPDVVVLAIFLGNDLVDASPNREEIRIVDGLLVPARSPRGVRAWLFRNSQLYAALKAVLERPAFRPLRARVGLAEPWTLRVLREELAVYARDAEERLQPAIAVTDGALAALAADAAADGVELVALLVPSELQVDPGRWQAALDVLAAAAGDYDVEIPRRIFRGLLERHGIPYVDPSARLAAGIRAGRRFYYRLDRHWTAEGHRVAAEELARFLAAGHGWRPAGGGPAALSPGPAAQAPRPAAGGD